MTNQAEIKDWIMNNFPLLFTGFHNWFTSRLRETKHVRVKRHFSKENTTSYILRTRMKTNLKDNRIAKPKDMSDFMNIATIWFLVSNLPNNFTKDLASENGTIFEKLRNCLIVSFHFCLN